MSAPTPYPELNGVLARLLRGTQGALGPDLVALYLQGSFALGDFDEHSDCDFVVAVREPLSAVQVDALQAVHARVFDRPEGWAQHLEGSYFPVEVLRSIDRRGEQLWYVDHGARRMSRSTHCNTIVVRQTVREHGVVLHGPAPSMLVDPIPLARLRGEMLATMCDWAAQIRADPEAWNNRFYQGLIALTYCRIWCDLTLGSVGSKRRGAAWAKPQLQPTWADLVDRAWATRPDPYTSSRTPADPDDYAATLDLMDWIVERGRAFARSAGIEPDPQG